MRFILPLLLSFIMINCCAQVDIINRTVTRKDSSFIFKEMSNLFAITGIKSTNWQLKSRHAKIEQTDSPWVFEVETYRLGADTFYLVQNGKTVLTKIFNVIPEPPIVVRWGVLKTDTATTTEVIANKKIIISIPGCSYYRPFIVYYFNITFITDELPAWNKMISVEGNSLPQAAANSILKLKHGDKIVFSSIRVVCRSGRNREVPGFTIVIK